MPYAIGLLIFNWVIGIASLKGIKAALKNPFFIIAVVFYFLYLISDLYSFSVDASFDLREKVSLFIFPVIIFSSFRLSKEQVVTIVKSLCYGCFFACIIALIHAFILYFQYHQFAFYYSPLATFHHPGYLAMYIDLSVAVLIYSLFFNAKGLSRFKTSFIIFQLIFFTIFLALLISKMGIICYCVILIVTAFYLFKRKQKIKMGFMIITGLAIILFLSSDFLVTRDYKRFIAVENSIEQHQLNASSVESTNVRVFVWSSACKVIKRNIFAGVGTGHVEDSLMAQYKNDKVTGAFKEHLNAHNQFLQTTLALGILGGLLLLFNLIYPSVFAIKNDNYLYLVFLIIIFMNCLTESVLESQAGVVFYGFINALFAANITSFKPEKNIETSY